VLAAGNNTHSGSEDEEEDEEERPQSAASSDVEMTEAWDARHPNKRCNDEAEEDGAIVRRKRRRGERIDYAVLNELMFGQGEDACEPEGSDHEYIPS
jgi:hypothetical protein